MRCRPLFAGIFRRYLGRHWIKRYARHFSLVGFQEFGRRHNRHAHFLLCSDLNGWAETIIETVRQLSLRINMDVWESPSEKATIPKQYGDDIMIRPIYSNLVFQYMTKEITRLPSCTLINDNIILDIDIIH